MRKKTDYRALKARRARALARPELRIPPKDRPPAPAEIDQAIALGKFTRLPDGRGKT